MGDLNRDVNLEPTHMYAETLPLCPLFCFQQLAIRLRSALIWVLLCHVHLAPPLNFPPLGRSLGGSDCCMLVLLAASLLARRCPASLLVQGIQRLPTSLSVSLSRAQPWPCLANPQPAELLVTHKTPATLNPHPPTCNTPEALQPP